MKTLLRQFLPQKIYNIMLKLRRDYRNWNYTKKKLIPLNYANYTILVPLNHPLIDFQKTQPYRDLCVGVSAKYLSEKYPDKTIIDIGANIGDTAFIISSYAKNDLILIEASDYFFEILEKNTYQLPNKVTLVKSLISNGSEMNVYPVHWGGTASFVQNKDEYLHQKVSSKRLSDIANKNVCMIKTDTDGYDFSIIADSLEYLSSTHSGILFENQIRNLDDMTKSNNLFSQLQNIDYLYFIVWDDQGFHCVSTNEISILRDLNRYLFKIWQNNLPGAKRFSNYDILCLHKKDKDIYEKISDYFQSY